MFQRLQVNGATNQCVASIVKICPDDSHHNLTELTSTCTLGTAADCNVVLATEGVSEHHAEVVCENGEYFLVDLGSEHGTYVNNSRVLEHQLVDGDLVRIGEAKFRFLSATNPEIAYHRRLQERAVRDGLTGAFNKSFMLAFLQRELNRCLLHDRPLSVLMMDIDFFKQVNDTHGHLAGDEVLTEFTRRISPLLDADDIFARYGGEEFAIVMCENCLDDAFDLGSRIREIIRSQPFATSQGDLQITVSIGIAGITGVEFDAPSPEALVHAADEMLYKAKADGRDRIVLPTMV